MGVEVDWRGRPEVHWHDAEAFSFAMPEDGVLLWVWTDRIEAIRPTWHSAVRVSDQRGWIHRATLRTPHHYRSRMAAGWAIEGYWRSLEGRGILVPEKPRYGAEVPDLLTLPGGERMLAALGWTPDAEAWLDTEANWLGAALTVVRPLLAEGTVLISKKLALCSPVQLRCPHGFGRVGGHGESAWTQQRQRKSSFTSWRYSKVNQGRVS